MLRTLSLDFKLVHKNCPDWTKENPKPEFEIDMQHKEGGITARCQCGSLVYIEFSKVEDGPTPV